jgi:hypothetical protein
VQAVMPRRGHLIDRSVRLCLQPTMMPNVQRHGSRRNMAVLSAMQRPPRERSHRGAVADRSGFLRADLDRIARLLNLVDEHVLFG